MNHTDPNRILIADDHRLFREGLRALLGSIAGLAVVGEATTGADAIRQAQALQPDVVPPTLFPELTDRARELLALLAQGYNNGEIAARLDLAVKTVRNHLSNIFNKLQGVDRAQAIIRAREAGMR